MEIVDPLKIKIQELLSDGQPYPLSQARARYGTESDIRQLVSAFREMRSGPRPYGLVDLTPFERVGRIQELVTELDKSRHPRPVLMVMSEAVLADLRSAFSPLPVMVCIYSESGDLTSIIGDSPKDQMLKAKVLGELKVGVNRFHLKWLRKWIAEQKLTGLLFYPDCLDIPSVDDPPETRALISGTYYRKMPNGMLVSCYLNLKQIGRDYRALTTLAYEIVLELMHHFRRDVRALDEFDALVTPNNTALFLASSVQAILEKPVVPIDRLGPIPALQLQTTRLREALNGRRVVLIEEVVATGNEVDRTIVFLNQVGAQLAKIVALYNLEVGTPLLVQPRQLVSLCRPKKELNYVYRSQ